MSGFIDLFDQEYLPKLGVRGSTFRAVIREANSRNVTTIVETGSMRKEDWEGDGQSTKIFNAWAYIDNLKFSTVDISEEAQNLVIEKCPSTTSFMMDSIKFLKGYKDTIDLLYLDSLDIDLPNTHDAALHTLMELTTAMPRLVPGSIVFIDDSPITTSMVVNGKAHYVAQYFDKLGIKPFTFGYQAAWIMP